MATPAPPLRVSVVVPVLNMVDTVAACLQALVTQSYPRALTEILVVDNGSTDGTAERVAAFPVTCLHEPVRGAPAARNRGIDAASGDVVAFTDADCVPTRGWLAHLAHGFADPFVNVVAGATTALDSDRSAIARYSARVAQYDPARSLAHPRFPYAGTGSVAIRRSLFERVGRFDPAQLTHDALEFFWRVRRADLLTYVVEPRAMVFYRTRTSLSAMARQHFGYGLGYSRFLGTVHDAGDGPAPTLGRVLASWARRMQWGLTGLTGSGWSAGALSCAAVHAVRETATAVGRAAGLPAARRRRPPR